MAELKKIKARIAELAARPKNVTFAEIEWVVDRLEEHGYAVRKKEWEHGVKIAINSQRFNICLHNRGSKQLKPCYVYEFINAMTELELYEG
jgi:hypothetical protein